MALLSLINIFAATTLVTALYKLTRPALDRIGRSIHVAKLMRRGRRSRLHERRSAVLLAAFGTGVILMINAFRFGGPTWAFFVGVPLAWSAVVYWYLRGKKLKREQAPLRVPVR